MATLTIAGTLYKTDPDETVLDTLLRHGVPVANSCRKGACCACLMRAMSGSIPAEAQSGLKDP